MSNLKKLGVIFSLFLLIGIFTGCGGGSAGPEGTVKEFFGYVEDGNADAAIDMMHTEVVNTVGEEKISKGIKDESKNISEKGGIENIEIVDKEEKEDEIEMKVKITYGNGTSKTDKTKLVKEDGDWKIGISK